MVRRWLVLAVLLGPSVAGAAASCVLQPLQMRIQSGSGNYVDTGWQPKGQAVLVAFAAACRSALMTAGGSCLGFNYATHTSGTQTWTITAEGSVPSDAAVISAVGDGNLVGSTGGAMTISDAVRYVRTPNALNSVAAVGVRFRYTPVGECPPDPCAGGAGDKEQWGGEGSEVPAKLCVSGCGYRAGGVGVALGNKWFSSYVAEGQSCAIAPEDYSDPEDEGGREGVNCITSAAGRVCVSRQQPNCGSVNGEAVCLDSVPEGACTLLSGGGMVCASDAPPVVDSGDVPLVADAQVALKDPATGATKVFDYFSSTSVASAAGGVPGSSNDTPQGGGSGSGGEGEAVEECSGLLDCYGSLPSELASCSEDIPACLTGIVGGAWDTVTGAVPILGVTSGVLAAFGTGGSCPSVSITVFDETYDAMAPFCDLVDGSASLLQLIWQVCWSILGFRILLRPDGESA